MDNLNAKRKRGRNGGRSQSSSVLHSNKIYGFQPYHGLTRAHWPGILETTAALIYFLDSDGRETSPHPVA